MAFLLFVCAWPLYLSLDGGRGTDARAMVKKTLLGAWESETEEGRASGCHWETGAYFWGSERLRATPVKEQGSWVCVLKLLPATGWGNTSWAHATLTFIMDEMGANSTEAGNKASRQETVTARSPVYKMTLNRGQFLLPFERDSNQECK